MAAQRPPAQVMAPFASLMLLQALSIPNASDQDPRVAIGVQQPIDCSSPVGIEQSRSLEIPLPLRAVAGVPTRQSPLQLSIGDKSNGAAQDQVTLSESGLIVSAVGAVDRWFVTYTVLDADNCNQIQSIELVANVEGPNFAGPAVAVVDLLGKKPFRPLRSRPLSPWIADRVGAGVYFIVGRDFDWIPQLSVAATARDELCWKCTDPRWAWMWAKHAQLLANRQMSEISTRSEIQSGYEKWATGVEYFASPPASLTGADEIPPGQPSDGGPRPDLPGRQSGVILHWNSDRVVLAFQRPGLRQFAVRPSQIWLQGQLVYDERK